MKKNRSKHKKNLKEGFSTGACAAAAAKAAALALVTPQEVFNGVDITFPDGVNRKIKIHKWNSNGSSAWASVIKDAGDDPDITHGAEIVARIKILEAGPAFIQIKGGPGVGTITKPGLPVPVGEPAINPVPKKMIEQAVCEVLGNIENVVEVTIEVPNGQDLAKKTLNKRLGILGGISILGTTGIVRPVSAEAWKATITAQMDVCIASGCRALVLATGRTSERAAQKELQLPEESFVTMGDYVKFSFEEAGKRNFEEIYLAAQWSKMVKIAMGCENTHVRFGPLEPDEAIKFLTMLWKDKQLGFDHHRPNTAREIYTQVESMGKQGIKLMKMVMAEAGKQLIPMLSSGQRLTIVLVSYEGKTVARLNADDV